MNRNVNILFLALAVLLAAALIATPVTMAGEQENDEKKTENKEEKLKKRTMKIYVKGEDLVEGISDQPKKYDFSRTIMHQFFELTIDSEAMRKKYAKVGGDSPGWKNLRKKMEINNTLENTDLLYPGQRRWSKDEEGNWIKGKEYTDEELKGFADFIVETGGNALMEEIKYFGKVTHYKYIATVSIKITNAHTGKVVFEKTNKADYTNRKERGKEFVAMAAIRKAIRPIAIEAVSLEAFSEKVKAIDEAFEKIVKEREAAKKNGEEKDETPDLMKKLESNTVSLDFEEAPLEDVLSFLYTVSSVEFKLAEGVDAEKLPAVTVKVEKATLKKVMDQVCKSAGMEWKVEKDAVVLFLKK